MSNRYLLLITLVVLCNAYHIVVFNDICAMEFECCKEENTEKSLFALGILPGSGQIQKIMENQPEFVRKLLDEYEKNGKQFTLEEACDQFMENTRIGEGESRSLRDLYNDMTLVWISKGVLYLIDHYFPNLLQDQELSDKEDLYNYSMIAACLHLKMCERKFGWFHGNRVATFEKLFNYYFEGKHIAFEEKKIKKQQRIAYSQSEEFLTIQEEEDNDDVRLE